MTPNPSAPTPSRNLFWNVLGFMPEFILTISGDDDEATKVKKPQVTIDVSADCPFLAVLLKAIAESPNRPKYLLHQYAWRQRKFFGKHYTNGTNYNQRLAAATLSAVGSVVSVSPSGWPGIPGSHRTPVDANSASEGMWFAAA